MVWKSGMVLASPGPLLTPPPSSSPQKRGDVRTRSPTFDPRMKRRTPPALVRVQGVTSHCGLQRGEQAGQPHQLAVRVSSRTQCGPTVPSAAYITTWGVCF
jgi:hypothetical protein